LSAYDWHQAIFFLPKTLEVEPQLAGVAEQHVPVAVVEEELALAEVEEVLHFLVEEEVVHADVELPEVVEVAVGRGTREEVQHTGHPRLLTPLLEAEVYGG
jgi:hypothetical protein